MTLLNVLRVGVGAHLVLGLGAVWVGWALAQRLWS